MCPKMKPDSHNKVFHIQRQHTFQQRNPMHIHYIEQCVCLADIAPEWMQKWTGNLELDSSLHLPAENEFIGEFASDSRLFDSRITLATGSAQRLCHF